MAYSLFLENMNIIGNNLIVLPQSQLQKKICSELHSAKLVSYFQKKSQINSSFILKRVFMESL